MVYREVTYFAIIVRILAAVFLGGVIGMERGMKNRPAGLRTYMLVCVGSCLVMLINQYIYQVLQTGDPVRLSAQVVSGIGFLGAGTIVVTKHNQIKGLTTAAGLWAAAGVGLALGIGFYEAAVCSAMAIFIIMTVFQRLDNKMRNTAKAVELYVEILDNNLGGFIRCVRDLNLDVESIQLENDGSMDNGNAVIVSLRSHNRVNHKQLMEKLREIQGVLYLVEI